MQLNPTEVPLDERQLKVTSPIHPHKHEAPLYTLVTQSREMSTETSLLPRTRALLLLCADARRCQQCARCRETGQGHSWGDGPRRHDRQVCK